MPIALPFFYGWIIVAVSAMAMFFSGPGQTYSIAVFIDAYLKDFGWSSTLVSTMYMFATILAGCLLFIVGRAIDRFGARKMIVIIAGSLGLATLFNSFIAGPIMLFFGFFMLRLLGQGSMTLLPNTLVPQWFIQKRGKSMSFMAVGGFMGASILPPLNAWLIDTYSWPVAWRIWSILLFFLFIPIAFVFIRNKPEDVGLLPDGLLEKENREDKTNQSKIIEDSWTLKEAMKTRTFWLILFCVSVPSLVNTGIVFHFISMMGQQGISRQTAAFILSLMAFISFPISLVAGVVVDKIKVNYILTVTFLAQCFIMVFLAFTVNEWMAIAFGVARGIVGGFEAISLGIIWPNYFGRASLGSIRGVSMTVMVLGSAFGPLPLAMAFDRVGNFQGMLLLMTILPIIAAIFAFISTKPKRDITVG